MHEFLHKKKPFLCLKMLLKKKPNKKETKSEQKHLKTLLK